jgi:nucleoside-triphosphatase THEP1
MVKVLMISGKQGSGKSSLADALATRLVETGHNVYRTRFAKVIYEMHDAVRDIGRKYGIDMPEKDGPLLQYLGTERGRNVHGDNVWVDALKKDISLNAGKNDIVIIDDMRFENECDAFDGESPNVAQIRLEADKEVRKQRCSMWRENDTHPSEIGLDKYSYETMNGIKEHFDLVIKTDTYDADETLNKAYDFLKIFFI